MFAASDKSDVGALVASNDAVFWVQVRSSKANGSIWALGGIVLRARSPSDAPAPIGSINSLNFGAIAVDDASVYLLQSGERTQEDHGRVLAVPQAGGPARTVAQTRDFALYAKVDANNVYWRRNESGNNTMMFVRKTGGVEAPFAPDLCAEVNDIAFDAAYVYVSCGDRTLWRLTPGGGARTKVADDIEPSELAVDADFIYLAHSDGISRIAKPK
jgi:hypothetical protein